jgi:drug/metabolite transporter (DMT)-like permease
VLIGPVAFRGIGGGGVAGQVAVLASGVSYACAGLYGRRLLSLSPVSASAGMLAGATLALLPLVCVIELPWHATPGVTTIAALLALALISTAAGYVLYFRILATAGPTNLLLVTLLMPIGALALGAAVLHERPSPASLAGMVLIFCGLAIIDGRLRGVRIFGHSQAARGVGRSRTGC